MAQELQFPVIKGYGGVKPMPQAAVQPAKNLEYKIVFDVTGQADQPEAVDAGLDRIARFINVYAIGGVPPQKMKLVAVLHGASARAVLDDAHYRERFKVDNPNHDLIRQLKAAGVQLYVCGQSLVHAKLEEAWVLPDFQITLSALVAVPTFELQGYTRVGM